MRGLSPSFKIVFILLISFSFCSMAKKKQTTGSPVQHPVVGRKIQNSESMVSDLEKIVQQSGFKNNVGIFIAESQSESSALLQVQPDHKLIPASISKIATAATVLEKILPGTRLKTGLWSQASIQDGVLLGDLYLKGAGDPSFVSENMWVLVNNFTRQKIHTIQGDIVVDDSLFDELRFDPTRQDERVDRAYDAPVGAMSFNWNSINVYARPGKKVADPAQVFIDPENNYTHLISHVKTVEKCDDPCIQIDRSFDAKEKKEIVTVHGKARMQQEGKKEILAFANITHPDLWSGENLKSFLAQRGIRVQGAVRAGKVKEAAKLLAESESKPIEDMVVDVNKFSNNFVAEMLTKNIAVANGSSVGTLSEGLKVIRSLMRTIGLDESSFELENPSGLTRKNKFTPRAMWRVLDYVKKDFRIYPEFLRSLPIAGIDGTLKKRMKGSVAERYVRAKTGLLTGVVSLAGFAGRSDGTVIPFVMMYNGNADAEQVRHFFDKIAIRLVE